MNTFQVSETADKIISLLNHNLSLFDGFVNVYLFGSVLKKTNKIPEDIDILLIYTEQSETLLSSLETIRSILSDCSGMRIDLTVLSYVEEQEVCFLDRLNSCYIKVK